MRETSSSSSPHAPRPTCDDGAAGCRVWCHARAAAVACACPRGCISKRAHRLRVLATMLLVLGVVRFHCIRGQHEQLPAQLYRALYESCDASVLVLSRVTSLQLIISPRLFYQNSLPSHASAPLRLFSSLYRPYAALPDAATALRPLNGRVPKNDLKYSRAYTPRSRAPLYLYRIIAYAEPTALQVVSACPRPAPFPSNCSLSRMPTLCTHVCSSSRSRT